MMHLCLQCIRKFTTEPYELIVIDNGSGDHPSLDYLKGIGWIKLIVRDPSEIGPSPGKAQSQDCRLLFTAWSWRGLNQ